MPAKKPTSKDLEALGAERLAALLMELAEDDAAIRRRLRYALAQTRGADAVAREVRKRLAGMRRAGSFIDWHRAKQLAGDLEQQRALIVDKIAPEDPVTALELAWRFMELAEPVYARCDDSSGWVGSVFRTMVEDLGRIATAAQPDPAALADRLAEAVSSNGYGQYDRLVPVLAPALGAVGLARLKAHFSARLAAEPDQRESAVCRSVLMDVADAEGDPDAYAALHDAKLRRVPKIAAEIARRFLAAGRAAEALAALEEAPTEPRRLWPDFAWEDARIDALEALGRQDEAQALRWSCFERSLSSGHLRDYLKRLRPVEQLDTEERAMAFAQEYKSALQSLSFFVHWPALQEAARLVTRRAADLDGNHYHLLSPAAEALMARHPLAASLALRAMIDDTLEHGRSTRYRHAVRHLATCAALAAGILDWQGFESHEDYRARLAERHKRKVSFWSGCQLS
jgi:hypothetical protein